MSAALIVTAVLAVVVTVLVWRVSGFRDAGFTAPRDWRNLHLLILPTVLAFIPLLAGFRPVDALATLIVGYALTGFMEEALWRGLSCGCCGPPARCRPYCSARCCSGPPIWRTCCSGTT